MRLLFITRKYPPGHGGMEQVAYNLYSNLKINKKLIALRKQSKAHLLWFLPYAFFKAFITQNTYDVIYLGDGVLGYLGVLLKKVTKKPIIITIHGLELTYPSKIHQKYNIENLKELDHIVTISNFTKNATISKGVPENKISIIPNGVKVVPSITKNRNNKLSLLTVGRLIERKGVNWFLAEVLPHLENAEYTIVGSGPEKKKIQNTIKQKRLSQSVKLLHNIEIDELINQYSQADLFIMPNLTVEDDAEGFGVVALEAAAHKTPVLAANVDGIPDAVTKETGILLPEKNAQKWIEAIQNFQENPDKIANLGESARYFVKVNRTWDAIAKKYQEIFEQHSK